MRRLVALTIAVIVISAVSIRTPSQAADFAADSPFPANPAEGNGVFAFDLEMAIAIRSDRTTGEATVHVNSRDGSMTLASPHASLWGFGMPDVPGLQIHHVVVRSGGIMACGRHPLHGDGCMPFGGDIVPGFSAWASEQAAERFFASVAATDQSAAPGFVAGTEGLAFVHGTGASGEDLTFWFDPGRSTIATRMPFLGPGVGVMKDLRDRTNRTVRHAYVRFAAGRSPAQWVSIHLRRLAQRTHRIDLSGYAMVTAFTAPAIGEANRLGNRMMGRGAEIQGLARALEGCASGSAGSACREELRSRIDAVEELIGGDAFEFGRRHGLPMPAR